MIINGSNSPPCGNPDLNERIKTRAKHLESVTYNIWYYRDSLIILSTFFTFKLLRSERDELGPSAPKAFNQSEEMLELNVAVKDVEFKMYSKHLLAEYL